MAEPEFKTAEERKSPADNIFFLEFAKQTYPEFIAQKNKDWVLYGEDNDYLNYLINLFDKNAEHNAIVTGKASYITGKGLCYDKSKIEDTRQQAKLDTFLSKANEWESWNEIIPKMALDLELFNGYALQLVYGAGGKIENVYHIKFNNIRIHKDKKTALYCDNWDVYSPQKEESFKSFPLYNPDTKTGTVILYYKVYRPTAKKYADVYPVPDYIGCTSDIETDINITAFHYSNTEDGFTAGGMINFYNGEPTEEDKRKIVKKFNKSHTGPNRTGKLVFNFTNEDQKGAEFVSFPVDRLDKQFEVLGKRIQQKIFTGHKVTNPILFGIKTEGQLGNRNELLEAYEHFHKTYIELRRPHVLNTVRLIAQLKGLVYDVIDIVNAEPIGVDVPISETEIANSLSYDEKRQLISKKYGIELTAIEDDKDKRLTLANKLGVGGLASLMQVIQSQIPAEQKVQILNGVFGVSLAKAYKITGFTPQTAQPTVQGQNMSSKKDRVLELLLACKHDPTEDEILEVKCIDFDSPEAALKFEKMQAHKFDVEVQIKTVRNKILEILSGAPETKPDVIAKQLGLDVDYVMEQINHLIDKKLLAESEGGFQVTEKGISKAEDLDPVLETEVYTMYKYDVRDGVPKAESGSREFCETLMNEGGEWSREEIEQISKETGENVWVYRGGFYHNPNTDETTPYCRHIWKAITRTRRKK